MRVNEETVVMIVARFADSLRAESASSTIEEMLLSAASEVDALFERQGGVADIADVSDIYTRYGFRNDVGWRHEIPIITEENEVFWELPEGLVVEEAQILLLALGAQAIAVQHADEEEMWRHSFPPGAMLMLDEDADSGDSEEDEQPRPPLAQKKILH